MRRETEEVINYQPIQLPISRQSCKTFKYFHLPSENGKVLTDIKE